MNNKNFLYYLRLTMSKSELKRLGIIFNTKTNNVDSPNLKLRNTASRNNNDKIITKNQLNSMKYVRLFSVE